VIKIIQIIDSLDAGGAERVAVNYANGLANMTEGSHICVTRKEGPLSKSIDPNVGYLYLNKKSILDIKAVLKLKKYIVSQKINVIQAHSTSFFIAILVKIVLPKVKIFWHDHYGNSEFLNERPKFLLRISSRLFSHIFCVNSKLKQWSLENLNCKNVKYVKNFPVLNSSDDEKTTLAGLEGKRILCLANLRDQKNHIRLLEAMKIVKQNYPDWTLHCVGKDFNDAYSALFFSKLKEFQLEKHVYFYDSRSDILNIMQQSSIGVLVSVSEGLPLALLEYGFAQLPVIATNVGNCGMLIPDKSHGILLESDNKTFIADAIINYIADSKYRASCATNFYKKIDKEYSRETILNSCIKIYKSYVS